MYRNTILISLYAFLSRFGILILNWNMLLNHCNITISLCFSATMLIMSAIYEFTLDECLAYYSLHITSFYRYTCLLSIKLSMVAITVLHRYIWRHSTYIWLSYIAQHAHWLYLQCMASCDCSTFNSELTLHSCTTGLVCSPCALSCDKIFIMLRIVILHHSPT